MEHINCYKPGTEVTIGDDIPGVIHYAAIYSDGSVVYEIMWWNGRDRMRDNFNEAEFSAKLPKSTIGFCDGQKADEAVRNSAEETFLKDLRKSFDNERYSEAFDSIDCRLKVLEMRNGG